MVFSRVLSNAGSLPHSLTSSRSHALTHARSLAPSLTHSLNALTPLTPSRSHDLTPSLTPAPSLPHSLTPSLPSLPSLPHSLTYSLTHSLTFTPGRRVDKSWVTEYLQTGRFLHEPGHCTMISNKPKSLPVGTLSHILRRTNVFHAGLASDFVVCSRLLVLVEGRFMFRTLPAQSRHGKPSGKLEDFTAWRSTSAISTADQSRIVCPCSSQFLSIKHQQLQRQGQRHRLLTWPAQKKKRFWGFGLPQAAFVIATALLLQKAEIDNEGSWEHWSST